MENLYVRQCLLYSGAYRIWLVLASFFVLPLGKSGHRAMDGWMDGRTGAGNSSIHASSPVDPIQ